ncbi:MAG: lipid-binding SYLF domain-containing protein [Nitrospira sp.]
MSSRWDIFRFQQSDRRRLRVIIAAALILFMAPGISRADTEQDQLVEKARLTVQAFMTDESVKDELRSFSKEAKGLFIVPQLLRGAFVFGGAGGSGVLIVRNEKTGAWSQPAFYNIGAVTFGLQAGGDASELIFVVRTQKGLEQFYRSDFKLGADTGLSIGPVGGSASVAGITADLVSYGRTKGAFAGMSVDGVVVAVSDESNEGYYGKPVRPVDILVKNAVGNPKSAGLHAAAGDLMK